MNGEMDSVILRTLKHDKGLVLQEILLGLSERGCSFSGPVVLGRLQALRRMDAVRAQKRSNTDNLEWFFKVTPPLDMLGEADPCVGTSRSAAPVVSRPLAPTASGDASCVGTSRSSAPVVAMHRVPVPSKDHSELLRLMQGVYDFMMYDDGDARHPEPACYGIELQGSGGLTVDDALRILYWRRKEMDLIEETLDQVKSIDPNLPTPVRLGIMVGRYVQSIEEK